MIKFPNGQKKRKEIENLTIKGLKIQ